MKRWWRHFVLALLLIGYSLVRLCYQAPEPTVLPVVSVSDFKILSIALGTRVEEVYSRLGKPLSVEPRSNFEYLFYDIASLPAQPGQYNMFVSIDAHRTVISISGSPLVVRAERLGRRSDYSTVTAVFRSLGAPEASVGRVNGIAYHLTYDFPDGSVEAFFSADGQSTSYCMSNRGTDTGSPHETKEVVR